MTPSFGKLLQVFRVYSTPADGFRYYSLLWKLGHGRKNIVPVKVRALGGIPVFCRPGTSDAHVLWETFHGLYHLPPVALAGKPTILDLGCNVGYTMAHFASLYPGAKIIGLEMDGENCRMAKINTRPFADRCMIANVAVWKSSGEISYDGADQSAFRIVERGTTGRKKVAAKTLDGIFEEYGLTHVEYLKMDIEGAETDVLDGGMAWAERVSAMKIEVHEPGDMAQIMKALESKGFVCGTDDRHWSCCVAVKPDAVGGHRAGSSGTGK